MRITDTSDLCWKSAVIYCLDIETFYDANADGIGDLAGLAERIDYLAEPRRVRSRSPYPRERPPMQSAGRS